MDTLLATSQANLASKQRELCTQSKLHLLNNIQISVLEQEQMEATEDLNRLTRNNQFEVEKLRRAQLSVGVDPLSQLQKTQIQLKIAERQVNVAERQLQIATAHVQNSMDPMNFSDNLSQQSTYRKALDFQNRAMTLFSEASDLLKQARHSLAFKELGARQRMGSASFNRNRDELQRFQTGHGESDRTGNEMEKEKQKSHDEYYPVNQSTIVKPFPLATDITYTQHEMDKSNNYEESSIPMSWQTRTNNIQLQPIDGTTGEGHHDTLFTKPPNYQVSVESTGDKGTRSSCSPCLCIVLTVIILLIAGGGGFAVYWYLIK